MNHPMLSGLRHRSAHELRELIYEHGEDFAKNFDAWMAVNGDIFEALVERAWRMKKGGRVHFGISELWEHARLFSQHREFDSKYKLTNAWRADVSRLMMLAYPKLDGFFKVSKRKEHLLGCYGWKNAGRDPGQPGAQAPGRGSGAVEFPSRGRDQVRPTKEGVDGQAHQGTGDTGAPA